MPPQFTFRRGRCPVRYPNQIRDYRLRAQITQRALAERVGGHRSMVSAWERGSVLPTLPYLFRLARALDTLAESLYASLYFPKRESEPSDKL